MSRRILAPLRVVLLTIAAVCASVGACVTIPAEPAAEGAGQGASNPVDGGVSLGEEIGETGIRGAFHGRNNTDRTQVLRYVIMVLDAEGHDVVPPVIGEPLRVRRSSFRSQSLTLPPLPEGRHWLLVHVETESGEVGGSNAYLEVEGNRAREIDYFRFSGQEERTSPSLKLPAHAGVRFARPPGEWQGMLPDRAAVWAWTAEQPCAMARAFVDGFCLPCVRDVECEKGEKCVLGHCVRAPEVECRVRADCQPGELCILTGYTSDDPRGNADMRARCQGASGGVPDAQAQAQVQEAAAQGGQEAGAQGGQEVAAQGSGVQQQPPPPSGPSPVERAAAVLRQSRGSR